MSTQKSSGIDLSILLSYVVLVFIGLLMIYSTTFNDYESSMWSLSSPFGGQAMYAVISLFVVLILSNISWHLWDTISAALYGLGIVLLFAVIIFGSEIKGAKSWLIIGPLSLQPGEFAKVSTALLLSSLLSSVHVKLDNLKSQAYLAGIMGLPALLIIAQPDPGSALTYLSFIIVFYRYGMPVVYYLGLIALFFVTILSLNSGFYATACVITLVSAALTSKVSLKNYIPGLIMIAVALSCFLLFRYGHGLYALLLCLVFLVVHLTLFFSSSRSYERLIIISAIGILSVLSFASTYAFNNVLKPHQQDRINVWLNPEKSDPRGSYYNLAHSKLAIGSGGISGKGYMNGTMTKLNYVPEQTTDFIFSSIGEEQGFLGSAAVICLFLFLILRIIKIGEQSDINYIRAFCYCIAGILFVHFFVNIGMTMGISPVIGIPLPFISKGGSSLLAFSIMIGIVLNMSKQKR